MSVFARMINLTKAAAHELLEKLENPVMMMNQYVREMQDELTTLKQEHAKQEAAARSLKLQAEESSRLVSVYESKAIDALAGSREAEAREALSAKLHFAEKALKHQELHEQAVTRTQELALKLTEAQAELETMQKKRTELTARVQQAQAKSRTEMPSFSSGFNLDGGSAARGFGRIEEKILEWEARLELAGHSSNPYGAATTSPSAATGFSSAPAQPATDPAKEALISEQLELLRQKLPKQDQ